MDKIVEQEIKELVTNITDAINVKKIYLFGSYAYGTPTKDSDIDLCVLTEDKRRKIEIISELQYLTYKKSKHSIDIVVYQPEEFEDRINSITTLEKTIAQKGVVIYG